MRISLALLSLVYISSAFAQSPSDKVSLTITRGELQVIGQGIMELPYKTAAPVMQSLQAQLAASEKAAAAAVAAKAKADADAKAAADAKAKAEANPEDKHE